jgi:hypothetical protein
VGIAKALPANFSGDFLMAIVTVPLESNWYTRRPSENKVVFSFHEIKDVLAFNNVPLENVIYRLLYAYTLAYRRYGNRIPGATEYTEYAHDETRGCLFDMNPLKADVIHSCHEPIICSDCVNRLRKQKVSEETIKAAQTEIRKIRKVLFYRIADFIKQHPLWSLVISVLSAIALSSVGSAIGAYVYDVITTPR